MIKLCCNNYDNNSSISPSGLKRIQRLVRDMIDIDCVDHQRIPPLLLLLRNLKNHGESLIETVRCFIQYRVAINSVDDKGRNALHFLMKYYKHGNLKELIQLLITAKIDINSIDNDGLNSLHYLIQYNSNHLEMTSIIQLLKENGAEVDDVTYTLVDKHILVNREVVLELLGLADKRKGPLKIRSGLVHGAKKRKTME